MRAHACLGLALLILAGCASRDEGPEGTAGRRGPLEKVAELDTMPTGITVSQEGRVFVSFPRWEDPIPYTVAELVNGKPVPYPDLAQNEGRTPEQLICVQSVVVDPRDRLWLLDAGSIDFGPVVRDGPKLVGIDLATNERFAVIRFPEDVVLPTTYLNDVRFDLRDGRELAFITDSSANGPNAIIVVDLVSGRSWRKLNDHPSTRPDPQFQAILDGRAFMMREPEHPPKPLRIGADGIAITADRLFFCPLTSRTLYSVSLEALADEDLPDLEVAGTLVEHARDFASDGLQSDAEGRIYLTDWEHDAIKRFDPRAGSRRFVTLIRDADVSWPDTLALSGDGYLYVTASQLQGQRKFNDGKDRRERPFSVYRFRVDTHPALMK
jgi:sugar lactone lactonase YvrE